MRFIIEARLADEGSDTGQDVDRVVAVIERPDCSLADAGLTLAEGQSLLAKVQAELVSMQVEGWLSGQTHCQCCGVKCSGLPLHFAGDEALAYTGENTIDPTENLPHGNDQRTAKPAGNQALDWAVTKSAGDPHSAPKARSPLSTDDQGRSFELFQVIRLDDIVERSKSVTPESSWNPRRI